MVNTQKIINNIKLFLLFLYLTLFFIFGADPNTIIYSEIVLVLLLGLQILTIFRQKKIKINPAIISLLIFSFWGLLSSLWAINPNLSLSRVRTIILLTIFLTLNYFDFESKEENIKKLFKVLMYSGLCFSIYVMLYYGISNYINMILEGTRIGGEIDNVNNIGLTTAITFLIVLFMGANYNKKYYIFLILPLLVTVGTGSRTALIELVISLIFAILFFKDNKNFVSNIRKIFVLFIVLLVSYKILQILNLNILEKRFETMFNYVKGSGSYDNSTYLRMSFIKEGLNTFYKYPINGIGINNGGYITIKVVMGFFTYLHNNYVELLATTGMVGFVLYYYVYFYIIKNCIVNLKQKNKYVFLVLVLCIVLLIGDFGTVSYYSKSTFVYFLCCFVAIEHFKKGEKELDENN